MNVLSESQVELSNRFAGRHKDMEQNRFEGFEWKTAVTGAPIFAGTQAYLDCKIVNHLECGDHTLYVGEVLALGIDEGKRPLIFYRSHYLGLDGLKPLA